MINKYYFTSIMLSSRQIPPLHSKIAHICINVECVCVCVCVCTASRLSSILVLIISSPPLFLASAPHGTVRAQLRHTALNINHSLLSTLNDISSVGLFHCAPVSLCISPLLLVSFVLSFAMLYTTPIYSNF